MRVAVEYETQAGEKKYIVWRYATQEATDKKIYSMLATGHRVFIEHGWKTFIELKKYNTADGFGRWQFYRASEQIKIEYPK